MSGSTRLALGCRIRYDGEVREVVGLERGAVRLRTCGQLSVVLVTEVLAAADFTVVATADGHPPAEVGVEVGWALGVLDGVPPGVRRQAEELAGWLLLMRTGYRHGQPVDDQEVADARFAPELPLGVRQDTLARTLGTTRRQVQRWAKAYDEFGVAGLVDRRRLGLQRPLGRIDPRVRVALVEVLDAQTSRSKVSNVETRRQVGELLRARHGPQAPPVPPPSTFNRYLAELGRGRGRGGSAKGMRSIANRPPAPYRRFHASRPGECVLVDSSPVDVFAMDPVSFTWQRVTVTLAMDLFTRSIVAWRFTPGDPQAVDACLLLHDILTPKPLRPGWEPGAAWRYPGVPEQLVVELGAHPAAGLPAVWPETVVVDHGRIFVSADFREACRLLGVTVQFARPFTPTDKELASHCTSCG